MSTITTTHLDAETAQRAATGAAAKAREMKIPMSIAVCDAAGQLKLFVRMDGASQISMQIAQDKAYTSAATGMPTHAWHDFIKEDAPLLHGIVHTPRLIVFGGGFPIKEGGAIVGAIGISGGHYTHDMEVARAALEAIGSEV